MAFLGHTTDGCQEPSSRGQVGSWCLFIKRWMGLRTGVFVLQRCQPEGTEYHKGQKQNMRDHIKAVIQTRQAVSWPPSMCSEHRSVRSQPPQGCRVLTGLWGIADLHGLVCDCAEVVETGRAAASSDTGKRSFYRRERSLPSSQQGPGRVLAACLPSAIPQP